MGKITITSIIIFVVVLITSSVIFAVTYQSAREQYSDDHDLTKQVVLGQGKIKSVEGIETYYGQKKFHVLTGVNQKNEKVYVWVPQTNKQEAEIIIKKQSSGITEEQAIAEVNKKYNPKKIIDVRLGMDEGIPIWEVKYQDASDRYTFDLVNYYNGEIIKHMAIKNEEVLK